MLTLPKSLIPYIILSLIFSHGLAYWRGTVSGEETGRDAVQKLWDADVKQKQDLAEKTRKSDQAAADAVDEAGLTGLITLTQNEYEIQQRKEDERAKNPALYGDDCRFSDGLLQLYADAVRTGRKD